MSAQVLVVEDDEDFLPELVTCIETLPGNPAVTVTRSRDSAFSALATTFFDVIVLDLKLPTVDRSLDAAVEHGRAVFSKITEVACGTPVCVLTGSSAETFVADMLSRAHRVDIWGEQCKVGTISFLPKYDFDKLPAILSPMVIAVSALWDVELLRSNNTKLSTQEDRLIRIFARRRGGTKCQIVQLGGGLSNAKVFRIKVNGERGNMVVNAVAKIASHAEVFSEADRYEKSVSRLAPGATPRKLGTLEFGAKDTAGVFYSLAEGFDNSLFDVLSVPGGDTPQFVHRVSMLQQPWSEGFPETRKSIAQVRRRVLRDEDCQKLASDFRLQWVAAFEQKTVQTRWCCIHGDLHGGNILVHQDGNVTLIDYGDVGDGPAALDPATLELSLLFHPEGSARKTPWLTHGQAREWGNLDRYLAGCPFQPFIRQCRHWGENVGGGRRELAACAYAYLIRQLKYPDTDKQLVIDLLQGVRNYYDLT